MHTNNNSDVCFSAAAALLGAGSNVSSPLVFLLDFFFPSTVSSEDQEDGRAAGCTADGNQAAADQQGECGDNAALRHGIHLNLSIPI